MKKHIIALLMVAGIAQATTNEITVAVSVKADKGVTDIQRKSGNVLVQMAGQKYNTLTVSATTTNAALSKGSVGTPGWVYMRNLSTNSTATVNISFDAGATTSLVLKATEPALFRAAPTADVTEWQVSAGAGSVDFEFTVIED